MRASRPPPCTRRIAKAATVPRAEAIRTGPHLMPVFGRRQLDDSQVDSVIRYLEYARDPDDPGGWGIGHIGPIPEGLAAWLVAGLGLVGVTRLIGNRMSGA